MKYVVVYEKSQTGWAAYVQDMQFYLDGMREGNLPIPEPSAEAEVISVSP